MSQFINYPTLDLVIGPMYSGKSTELIRRLTIFSEMKLKVLYVNSCIDDRSDNDFSTHSPLLKSLGNITSIKVNKLSELSDKIDDYDIIGIDEAQFFENLEKFVVNLVENKNKKVIIAGLSSDYKRENFGDIMPLVRYCDNITKLNPFCKMCIENHNIIKPALFTKRITESDEIIVVGSKEIYIPTCRLCYLK